MYWFELNIDKFNKAIENIEREDNGETEEQKRRKAAEQSGALSEITNCQTTFLYFQSNKLTRVGITAGLNSHTMAKPSKTPLPVDRLPPLRSLKNACYPLRLVFCLPAHPNNWTGW